MTRTTKISPEQSRRQSALNTFHHAFQIAKSGFESWAARPENAKWVRMIDGTPIPNDLQVHFAEALCHHIREQTPRCLKGDPCECDNTCGDDGKAGPRERSCIT